VSDLVRYDDGLAAIIESAVAKGVNVYMEDAKKVVGVILQEFMPVIKDYQVYKTTFPLRELEDGVGRAVRDRVKEEVQIKPQLAPHKKRLYAALNGALRKEFKVKRRHWIPQKLYGEALEYIQNYAFPADVAGKPTSPAAGGR